MVIRYRQGFEEHIIDADYVELEGVEEAKCQDGKWVFKSETD